MTAMSGWIAVGVLLGFAAAARADESAVTVLTGFEDDSVVARIAGVQNVSRNDCKLYPAGIPARTGHRSMKIEIGATERDARVVCRLQMRVETPFHQADRVAAFVCIYDGDVDLAFRVRDAAGEIFETRSTHVTQRGQFVRLTASLEPTKLKWVGGSSEADAPAMQWPIIVDGFAVLSPRIGRQDVYLDDIEVEHRVGEAQLVRGEFVLDEPTHLYEPGGTARAALRLENLSRSKPLQLAVRLAWVDSNGDELSSDRSTVSLPRSGVDYRSTQDVELDKRLTEPGLYRIVAEVREDRWPAPSKLETTVAALPSNRALPRGRETFFGLRSNTLREPPTDQEIEIELARRIGVQIMALGLPWDRLEPDRGVFDFEELDRVVAQLSEGDIAVCLSFEDAPAWLPAEPDARLEAQAAALTTLATHFGSRVEYYQVGSDLGGGLSPAAVADALQARLDAAGAKATVLTAPISVSEQPEPPVFAQSARTVLATVGQPGFAANALAEFASLHGRGRAGATTWLHEAAPQLGAGRYGDAIDVLRAFVNTAQRGYAGILWFDLRDDSADPRHIGEMRGMVARDFSPKRPLIGYAGGVGMLHGLRYDGPVVGAPDEYESALFVSAERQVAVLFPKPDRPLPAVLAPVVTASGRLEAMDFERRSVSILESSAPRLIPTLDHPLFISFTADRALKGAVLSLASQPWLATPRTVLCDREARFRIELTAPIALTRAQTRVQLVIPRDAPIESSLSSKRFGADAGDTVGFDVSLTRTGDTALAAFTMTLRLVLEGDRIEILIHVEPLVSLRHSAQPNRITGDSFLIMRLSQTGLANGEPVPVHGEYDDTSLRFAFAEPDRIAAGSALLFGISPADGSDPLEARIDSPWSAPKFVAVHGTPTSATEGWSVSKVSSDAVPYCVVQIPRAGVGSAVTRVGGRFKIAARIVETTTIFAGREWSSGPVLDGSRASNGYTWAEIAAPE